MNTAAVAAGPTLAEHASVAQRKLRATRAELRALLFEEEDSPDEFPRSATMRLLLNSASRRTAGAMLSLLLFKLSPGFARVLKAVPMSLLVRALFRTVR